MDNPFSLVSPVRASDSDLAGTALRAVSARHQIRNRSVTIQADRGIVTLRGIVRTYYERQLLIHDVNKAIRPLSEVRIVDELSVAASPGA